MIYFSGIVNFYIFMDYKQAIYKLSYNEHYYIRKLINKKTKFK